MTDQENPSSLSEEEITKREHADHLDASEAPQEEGSFSSSSFPKQVLVTDEELKELKKEAHEYKEKYLRLLADAENSRKRLQKEKQEIAKYAIERLVLDVLRPLDNLESALRFAGDMSDEIKQWAFGFQMILTQFKEALAEHGVRAFDSLGQPFNPHEHEAIEMIETKEEQEGTVLEEHTKGYKMADRVIRAARVKVAKSLSIQ